MKKILILFIPFILACGMPISAAVRNLPRPSVAPTPPKASVEMVVIAAESLNIRSEPNESAPADKFGLQAGQVVHVYTECTGGFVKAWVSINSDCTQWVRSKYLEAK